MAAGRGGVMPLDRSKYPDDWDEISLRVREAAAWRCEFCGAQNGKVHLETGSKVVLTVAHLDHDTSNNAVRNLRALCQRCHLRYDHELHIKHAAETRRRKRIEAGQIPLQ